MPQQTNSSPLSPDLPASTTDNCIKPGFTDIALDEKVELGSTKNERTENLGDKRSTDLDGILRKFATPGRYQLVLFIFTSLYAIVLASNNLAMIFFSQDSSAYSCTDTFMIEGDKSTVYPSSNQQCYTVHWTNTFHNVSLGNDRHCEVWRFPLTESGTEPITIVTDFSLVCQNKWRIALASSIYFVGVMVGAGVFGGLADRYGRRVICICTSAATAGLGIATSFTTNYTAFVGFMVYYSLLMEWLPLEKRSVFGTLTESFWSIGTMVLALYAYVFPNWNDIQLAISLTALVLAIIYFFLIEESLRWLLSQNRSQEAVKAARRVLRFNNIAKELSWDDEQELLSIAANLRQQEQKQHYNVIDCFRTPHLRKVTFCMTYLWAADSLCYYGLSFSINNLIGSPQLNLFIASILELIPYLASAYIVRSCVTNGIFSRFGRRTPTMVFSFIGGMACIISSFISNTDYSSNIGKAVLTFVGRMALSGSFVAFLIWTAELYPTVIRANGIGICSVALRIGSAIAPQIVLLGDYTLKELPIIILGLISLGSVLAAYPMIETMNQILPDTLEAAELFGLQNANKYDNCLSRRIRKFRRVPKQTDPENCNNPTDQIETTKVTNEK